MHSRNLNKRRNSHLSTTWTKLSSYLTTCSHDICTQQRLHLAPGKHAWLCQPRSRTHVIWSNWDIYTMASLRLIVSQQNLMPEIAESWSGLPFSRALSLNILHLKRTEFPRDSSSVSQPPPALGNTCWACHLARSQRNQRARSWREAPGTAALNFKERNKLSLRNPSEPSCLRKQRPLNN